MQLETMKVALTELLGNLVFKDQILDMIEAQALILHPQALHHEHLDLLEHTILLASKHLVQIVLPEHLLDHQGQHHDQTVVQEHIVEQEQHPVQTVQLVTTIQGMPKHPVYHELLDSLRILAALTAIQSAETVSAKATKNAMTAT